MSTDLPTAKPSAQPKEGEELLKITQPALRTQLLQARLVNEWCANCVIHRGEHVYLSLRTIPDVAKRREITFAILQLQMGAQLHPNDLPDPLRTALLAASMGPSPLIKSLIFGALCAVIGGVVSMAMIGLVVTILGGLSDSDVGVTATAVAFILSSTLIGCSSTVYFWRRFTRKTVVDSPQNPIFPIPAKSPK